MNHDRVAMLAALNLVKPALATKDLVEELAHVWFDGETVTAYNDADLGIQAPFESPFKGGIRGALILGLLHNSRAKEVIFEEVGEGEVMLKAARAKVRLSVLDPERAVYELPGESTNTFKFDDSFIDALKLSLLSVGNDTSIPEKMGVTISVTKQYIDFYTTDSKTIAHADIKRPEKGPKPGLRAILPTAFCEQLIRLCGNGGYLDVQDDIVMARNSDNVLIWARLVEMADKPFDFEGAMERNLKGSDNAEYEIPSRLSLALDRALTMLDGLPDEPAKFSVADGKLRVEVTAEGRGELKDSVDITGEAPEATFKIAPNLIKRALPLTTHMWASARVVYMQGEGFRYIATTTGTA